MRELRRAIARVVIGNRALIVKIGLVRGWYCQGESLPKGTQLASEALDCEANGEHVAMEEVVTCLKRLGRGRAPSGWVDNWLTLSSRRLLNELEDLAALLPGGLADAAERLAVAVNRARTREERIGNFVLGRSGAGENLDQAGYEKRLDGFLRDLKEDFLAIQSAFVIIESRNVRLRSAQKKKRQRKAPCRRPDSEAAATKRADLNAIRKEARRRYRDRNAKGRAQTLKQVLEEMYDSFPWGRRCRQWAFPTLYVQVVRNRVGL